MSSISETVTAKTIPKTMEAAVFDAFGGIEVLEGRTLPLPEVGPRDVLIHVAFAGVGSWEAEEREGDYQEAYEGGYGLEAKFPYVLGWDGAGTVAAVGSEVTRFGIGDRVYATTMPLPRGGFYAEYTVVEADYVTVVPENLTTEEAGVMPWDALTALSGLDELGLSRGDTFMILGASGGIGHFAVQLAKGVGAKVLAVASGEDGVALARQLGADIAIDGRQEDVLSIAREFAPGGVDKALVTFGGKAAKHALAAVREGGSVAIPHGVLPVPESRPGIHRHLYNADRKALARLSRLVAFGSLNAHVSDTLPLKEVQSAHRLLEGHHIGKIALQVGGSSDAAKGFTG